MGFVVQRRFVCAMFLAPPSIKKYQVEDYPARRPMAVCLALSDCRCCDFRAIEGCKATGKVREE
jgi:hypothetical protein